MKKTQLDKLIKEEVSKVLNEYEEGPFKQQFFSYVDDMKKMGFDNKKILDTFEEWLREIQGFDNESRRNRKPLDDMFKGIDHPDDMDY